MNRPWSLALVLAFASRGGTSAEVIPSVPQDPVSGLIMAGVRASGNAREEAEFRRAHAHVICYQKQDAGNRLPCPGARLDLVTGDKKKIGAFRTDTMGNLFVTAPPGKDLFIYLPESPGRSPASGYGPLRNGQVLEVELPAGK